MCPFFKIHLVYHSQVKEGVKFPVPRISGVTRVTSTFAELYLVYNQVLSGIIRWSCIIDPPPSLNYNMLYKTFHFSFQYTHMHCTNSQGLYSAGRQVYTHM